MKSWGCNNPWTSPPSPALCLVSQMHNPKPKGRQVTHRGHSWRGCWKAQRWGPHLYRELLASETASGRFGPPTSTPKPWNSQRSFSFTWKFLSHSLSISSRVLRMLGRNKSAKRSVIASSFAHYLSLTRSCSETTCIRMGQWQGARCLEMEPDMCAPDGLGTNTCHWDSAPDEQYFKINKIFNSFAEQMPHVNVHHRVPWKYSKGRVISPN